MPKYTLNGHTFEAQPLEPFGLELTSNEPVDVVELAQNDLTAIVEATHRFLLLVIRNTTDASHWSQLPSVVEEHSNSIWHADDHLMGHAVVNMFRSFGKQRKPTGFIKRLQLAEGLARQREYINPWFLNCPSNDPDIRSIGELYKMLSGDPSDIQTSLVHKLYTTLHQDHRVPNVFILNIWRARERSQTIQMRRACAKALRYFIRAVNADPNTTYYTHQWNEKPDSTVLVYNGEEDGDLVVGHCRIHDRIFSNEVPLGRKQMVEQGGDIKLL